MTEERYVVGAMTVTLTMKNGVPIEAECECERFARNQRDAMMQTMDEEKCRHIREAEIFAHFGRRVTPVRDE
ncbi:MULTISPECIES: hypothetical protein [Haloferax]|uniref:SWIM-type domain-containing protein n=1 Tax=Haloferax marinum TaxID=2666143 RepID=A0A6A8G6N3_9EURY|nr:MULTISPECIES: hypothetical protein [Haloferax]KAB1197740.1 hypothetical protein Hfx1150_09475 [Haloferax sp. CBA1150]MRW96794.1 hypothetical protein [Haloferax marinum]